MMNLNVTLSNGSKLVPNNIISNMVTFQGSSRKALDFVFPEDSYTLDELKNLFTEANCETITVDDVGIPGVDKQTSEYTGYVLFVGIRNERVEVSPGDEEHGPEYKSFNYVTMAKHTYQENQIRTLQDSIDHALLLVLNAVD